MTTVTDANVHNLAVKATFDDCQVRHFIDFYSSQNQNIHLGHSEGTLRGS